MNQQMRARVKDKLFSQFIKSEIRLGKNNNKIILRCDSKGRIFKLDSVGKRYVSIDDKEFPIYDIVVYSGDLVYENQVYGKTIIARKTIYVNTKGVAYSKSCTSCGKYGDIFNKGRTICRECQSNTKSEYRKTDGYIYSNDKRVRQQNITNDRTITRIAISRMLREQEGKCVYCKEIISIDTLHKDHIVPLSRGGIHSISNIQLLCPSCNLSKGSMTHEEYIAKDYS